MTTNLGIVLLMILTATIMAGSSPAADASWPPLKITADFENGMIGNVEQIGPDEFNISATPEKGKKDRKYRCGWLWFYCRIDGCAGREITFHLNVEPFSRERTGGNGMRLPVMSYDDDNWSCISGKEWSEDGKTLTFKQKFTQSPAWIASFFPFPPAHVARFAKKNQTNPFFKAGTVGMSDQGRPIPLYTITDFSVPEKDKRVVVFTALQHDLETSGAMVQEAICEFLLSADPVAAKLRRTCVFYVIPMMDPDGIANGNSYPSPGANMNRLWGQNKDKEIISVENFVKKLNADGRRVDIFMDFHGWCTLKPSVTQLHTIGKEIGNEENEAAIIPRLGNAIKTRMKAAGLSDLQRNTIWRKREINVVGGKYDVSLLAVGWMSIEGKARAACTIEIFGASDYTQEEYRKWGMAVARAIGDFYGITS